MRIFVEPSDYSLFNVGDVAMMDVAISRLTALWPNATIQILTDTPELLPATSPNVVPLSTEDRSRWLEEKYLSLNLFSRDVTKPFGARSFEKYLRRSRPEVTAVIQRLRGRLRRRNEDKTNRFLTAMQAADLVVVGGMGGITDVFEDYAFHLLDALHLAIRLGKTTAMFGQGLGPIQNPQLRAHAGKVLSQVDFIALRESRAGAPLLDSLGVARARVTTTGDDAIEKAFALRGDRLGDGIGVNVRCTAYSGIAQAEIDALREMLLEAARTYQAPIIPVPTSRHPSEEDSSTLRRLFGECGATSDYGQNLTTPQMVIEQIQRCRLVITGSYHAAVFALAQGTPVVCLANSLYYADKFAGLLAEFGGGGEVISLEANHDGAALRDSVARVWQSAQTIRPQLLASARKQIESGRAAYKRLYEIVSSKATASGAGSRR